MTEEINLNKTEEKRTRTPKAKVGDIKTSTRGNILIEEKQSTNGCVIRTFYKKD